MTDAAPSVKYGILCEDIRREDNGKLLVIGMYGGSVEVSEIPATLVFTILIAMNSEIQAESEIEVIMTLNEGQLSRAAGKVNFAGKGLALLSLPPIPLSIKEEGELAIKARLDDGPWTELWNGPISMKERRRISS
jgi:hypothetical protein